MINTEGADLGARGKMEMETETETEMESVTVKALGGEFYSVR